MNQGHESESSGPTESSLLPSPRIDVGFQFASSKRLRWVVRAALIASLLAAYILVQQHIAPVAREAGDIIVRTLLELLPVLACTFIIFFLFEARTLREVRSLVDDGAKQLQTFLSNPKVATVLFNRHSIRDALADSLHRDTKAPLQTISNSLLLLEKQLASYRSFRRDYRIHFSLRPLREDGYRPIHISCEYRILASTDVPINLKFRCALVDERETNTATWFDGYEFSWVFLNHPEDTSLPESAMTCPRVRRRRSGASTLEHVDCRESKEKRSSTLVEYESRQFQPQDDDVVVIDFEILQSDDYGFVADGVYGFVDGYSAECSISETGDIDTVFPKEVLITRDKPSISGPRADRVIIATKDLVLPGSGAIFCWSAGARGAQRERRASKTRRH